MYKSVNPTTILKATEHIQEMVFMLTWISSSCSSMISLRYMRCIIFHPYNPRWWWGWWLVRFLLMMIFVKNCRVSRDWFRYYWRCAYYDERNREYYQHHIMPGTYMMHKIELLSYFIQQTPSISGCCCNILVSLNIWQLPAWEDWSLIAMPGTCFATHWANRPCLPKNVLW